MFPCVHALPSLPPRANLCCPAQRGALPGGCTEAGGEIEDVDMQIENKAVLPLRSFALFCTHSISFSVPNVREGPAILCFSRRLGCGF